MSTVAVESGCQGTRYCPTPTASACARCQLLLCASHATETACGKGGAHRLAASKPAKPVGLTPCSGCRQPFRPQRSAKRCGSCVRESSRALVRRTCERCQRGFVAKSEARRCNDCRYLDRTGRSRKSKYVWTPERDAVLREVYERSGAGRPNVKRDAGKALGFPAWAVQRRAALLGLSRPANRRAWTPEEDAFLRAEVGKRTPAWIAKRLGRSVASVILKVKRERISLRACREWWSARDVAQLFGVDDHAALQWIAKSWLRAEKRGDRPRDSWMVTEPAIVEFVVRHPQEFRLDRVEQGEFIALLVRAGGLRAGATP